MSDLFPAASSSTAGASAPDSQSPSDPFDLLVEPPPASRQTVEQLHPKEHAPPPTNRDNLALAPRLATDAVVEALRSFPKGSGAGPSSLRAQHLLDALTPAQKATVAELLTEVAQILADGRAPEDLAPFLAGANLMASEKKNGGLRPIAVGGS